MAETAPPPLPAAAATPAAAPAPTTSRTGGERMALHKMLCPACGGEAQWNAGKQALICAWCGTESPYNIPTDGAFGEHDLLAALQALPQPNGDAPQDERRAVRCQHCQAISVFSAQQQGKACDFCGSTALLPFEQESDDLIRPESLLPFAISASAARDKVRVWYGSNFWAPNKLGSKALTDTLRGIYLPYWTFDAQAQASYTAEVGRNVRNYRGEMETEWFSVSGQVEHFFDDVLVCGSRGVPTALLAEVEPFPTTDALKPCDTAYLSGWTVERYQIDLSAAAQKARTHMLRALEKMCENDFRADIHRNLRMNAQFGRQSFKHVLLPVWLVSYRYRSKDYQVVVNGATGKVAGDHPWSWVKITIAVLLALLLVGLYFYMQEL